MKKILLVIQREYLSRVKKKSFLVVTFLVPVLFLVMIGAIAFISAKQNEFADRSKVAVVDESGRFLSKMKNSKMLEFVAAGNDYAAAKATFVKDGYDYLLHIPESLKGIQLLGEKKAGIMTTGKIEDELTNIIRAQRLAAAGIDSMVLAQAQKPVSIQAMQLTDEGEKDAQSWVATGIGFLSAFLIYMCLFVYGAQVMRGVIEEKVSRIVEVIISSVKPFQLMMGKIIGVGLVGLTQFFLWIIISAALSSVVGGAVASKMNVPTEQVSQLKNSSMAAATVSAATENNTEAGKILSDLASIPIAYTLACFLFYFFFGYMLYSALFAAVGSAVDNETETQQFMIPVTLPLIFTFMLGQSFMINNPDSSLSVWLSMIPFTAPVAMMIRIPFGVPAWQLGLSMLLMILGFLGTTWLAARIYRVGILMYGKKASYKELAKWIMYKD